MDHHCPWVANCIGFFNYKYFLNMLFHTAFASGLVAFTAFPLVFNLFKYNYTWTNDFASTNGVNIIVAYYVFTSYVLTCALCFIISGFFCFHLYLIMNGRTTIEYCEKRTELPYLHRISPFCHNCFKNF